MCQIRCAIHAHRRSLVELCSGARPHVWFQPDWNSLRAKILRQFSCNTRAGERQTCTHTIGLRFGNRSTNIIIIRSIKLSSQLHTRRTFNTRIFYTNINTLIYASPVRRVRWFIHSFVHSIGLFASTLALPSASSPQACIVAVLLLLLLLLKPKSIWCRNEANRRHRPKTQTTRACVQSLGALVRRPSKTTYEQKTKNAYNILVIQLWQTIWGFGYGFGPMHIYIRCWSLCACSEPYSIQYKSTFDRCRYCNW